MTVGELIRKLAEFPQDIEVFIEGQSGRNSDMPITDAEWNTTGQKSWVTLTDYHPHGYRKSN